MQLLNFVNTEAETGRAEVFTHKKTFKSDFRAHGIVSIRVPERTWNVTETLETVLGGGGGGCI